MAKQLGFVIEQNMCMGCKACQVACKDRANLEVGQLWRTVTEVEDGGYTEEGNAIRHDITSFWTTMACNHCENAVCIEVCPTGAMYKREEDGIVLVNKEVCIGCGACAEACPYDAPVLIEEENKMGKCDFCVDQIIEGKNPICVGSCPVRAIHFGEIGELREKYGKVDQTKGLPDPETKPSLVIVAHKDA